MQFHTQFTAAVAKLAASIKQNAALRLLLLLPEHLSYEVFKRLNQEEIAKQLDVDDSTISRALKTLEAAAVVERKGKGPYTEWRLSADFGWKGTVDGYHAHQRKRGKPAPADVIPLAVVAEGILWKERRRQVGRFSSTRVPALLFSGQTRTH